MKKFSLFLIAVLTMTALFTTSCKKEIENVENPKQVQESASVKSVINSLRSGPSQSAGNATQSQVTYAIDQFFCFDYVYPVSVVYNDGSVESFADINEFALAIVDETQSHYIIDFVYPFDITQNGTVTTINNDTDFTNAVNSCQTLDNFALSMNCFEFVYPVDVEMSDGSIVTANDQQGFSDLFASQSVYPVDMVYPFDYTENGNTHTVTNALDFQILLDDCVSGGNWVYHSDLPPFWVFGAFFNLDYPVTLVYNDGTTIVVNNETEYDAIIYNDFNNSTPNHYIVDFQYDFDVTDSSGVTTTIHNLQEFYDLINYYYNNLPSGGGNQGVVLPYSSEFPCFNIIYPVTIVYSDGSTLSVTSNTDYDQHLYGIQNILAVDFQYPITITQNGNTITINDRTEFDIYVSGCN